MNQTEETIQIAEETKETISGNRLAKLTPSDNPAVVLVQWDNYPPTQARYLADIDTKKLTGPENEGREVLVSFIDNDPEKPVIIGIMASLIDEMINLEIAPEETEKPEPREVIKDGKNITLTAENQITLKCGKGSITLQKDGKIIVKGTNLLSRSSGMNRIKGGSVGIN